MTREIKFAFWHKQKKEMWSVQSIDWITKEVCNGGDVANLDDGVLLEYIGLKDKNGRDIYEGNLVRYKFSYSDEFVNPVIYNKGCFKVDDDSKVGFLSVSWLLEHGDYLEVVGNIYESEIFKKN